MKATCYNCKNYVDTLVNPANPELHIHDWCRQWQRQLDPFALAGQLEYNGDTIKYAGMMELADMQDLGSCAAMRWGSNPHARTKEMAIKKI